MKAIFVIGPSGSGKSTFSRYLSDVYHSMADKEVLLINLDSANSGTLQTQREFKEQTQSKYTSKQNNNQSMCSFININDLITVQDIMEQQNIGPNGALLYAMNFLHQNLQWLVKQIKIRIKVYSQAYLILDMPGQIQLYLSHESIKKIIKELTKQFSMSSCCIELFDATFLYEPNQFTSLCMMSLATMINMQMPHINIINKIDIMKNRKPGAGMLNQYFDLTSMVDLTDTLCVQKDPLLQALAKILDSFGQVSFLPFSSYHEKTPEMIGQIVYQLEKIFGTLQLMLLSPFFCKIVEQAKCDYSRQQLITSLQNDLFDQEDDLDQIMQKIRKQIKDEKSKKVQQ